MNKEEVMLGALAAGKGHIYTPVQVQKLLFLIDKKIPEMIQGPYFNFVPYAYGPFDIEIYSILEQLGATGDVEIIRDSAVRWSRYRLTHQGQEKGEIILGKLNAEISAYIKSLSTFVKSLTFAELVAAIYSEYPEMKQNSIFK